MPVYTKLCTMIPRCLQRAEIVLHVLAQCGEDTNTSHAAAYTPPTIHFTVKLQFPWCSGDSNPNTHQTLCLIESLQGHMLLTWKRGFVWISQLWITGCAQDLRHRFQRQQNHSLTFLWLFFFFLSVPFLSVDFSREEMLSGAKTFMLKLPGRGRWSRWRPYEEPGLGLSPSSASIHSPDNSSSSGWTELGE